MNQKGRPWRRWILLVALALAAVFALGAIVSDGNTDPARTATEPRVSTAPDRPDCDSDYEGACLDPGSADYDCAGGSGDGPDYTGPVRSVGSDPFDLDRDGDGAACE